eukprot:SAG31_NODE_7332_length_1717_cov_1.289864_1_plen_33_part_10
MRGRGERRGGGGGGGWRGVVYARGYLGTDEYCR